MKVYGCNEETKVPVLVDLSIEQIWAAGIDPWRLDLFDPKPIKLNGISFRRLTNVSFGYYRDSRTGYIGIKDGHEVCIFRGKPIPNFKMEFTVSVLESMPGEHSFQEHFSEYLHLLENKAHSRESVGASWLFDLVPKVAAPKAFPPRVANHVTWSASELRLAGGSDFHIAPFSGEMFREMQIRVPFPPPLLWVFDAFAEFQPQVFGHALRRAISGKPIDTVHVLVPLSVAVTARCEQFGITPKLSHDGMLMSFEFNGCNYNFYGNALHPYEDLNTADMLFSRQSHVVRGSRIAFFDVGAKYIRMLRLTPLEFGGRLYTGTIRSFQERQMMLNELSTILEQDGYKYLP